MHVDLITKEDLQAFRYQLIEDMKMILLSKPETSKKWLKGSEVRNMLQISAGTLQNLRIKGQLKPSRIGGSFYYSSDEIEKILPKKA